MRTVPGAIPPDEVEALRVGDVVWKATLDGYQEGEVRQREDGKLFVKWKSRPKGYPRAEEMNQIYGHSCGRNLFRSRGPAAERTRDLVVRAGDARRAREEREGGGR